MGMILMLWCMYNDRLGCWVRHATILAFVGRIFAACCGIEVFARDISLKQQLAPRFHRGSWNCEFEGLIIMPSGL